MKEFRSPFKVKFVDFWPGFNDKDNYFTALLAQIAPFAISDNPDLLFYGCYGTTHRRYKCHKIFYASENIRPNFLCCDFAMSFERLATHRHFRLPLYLLYDNLENLLLPQKPTRPFHQREFCCFVVSNLHAKERIQFFKMLNSRRRVDSAGRALNNIGAPIINKREFIGNYRFTIAFENSSRPGYTTEKIFEPMLEGSIPIYWGNPRVGEEFNEDSFINVHSFRNFEDAIEEVLRLEGNPNAYEEKIARPWLPNNRVPVQVRQSYILTQLTSFIAQMDERNPVSNEPVFHLGVLAEQLNTAWYWLSKWTGVVRPFR